jgi:hypothetical protein
MIIALSPQNRVRESIRESARRRSGQIPPRSAVNPAFAGYFPTVFEILFDDFGEKPPGIDAQSIRELTELEHVQLPLTTFDLPDE